MYRKTLFYSVNSALLLYFFTIVEDVVYCVYSLSVISNSMVSIYILLGIFTTFVTVLYKFKSIIDSIIRYVVMVVAYILFLILGGTVKLIPLLRSLLNISVNSYVDNMFGMVLLSFFTAVVISGIIALFISCIKTFCRKRE